MSKSKKHFINELILYVVIAYSITWAILIPLIFYYNALDPIIREIWHVCGSIGPFIAGLISIIRIQGIEGMSKLKKRLVQVSRLELILFSLSPLIILTISLLFEYFIGWFDIIQFIQSNQLNSLGALFIFILPSLCYGTFEEFGWRGYLLPALQQKKDALISTLILTFIWWFWHFPTFFYRYDLIFALLMMLPLMFFGSAVFTFLFNQSKGSLLLVIIFHVCYNLVTSHQISITATLLTTIFFIFMAIRIIKEYGRQNLSKNVAIRF